MSEVAVAHPLVEPAESPLTPESWGKLGMWVFLAGDAMSFGALIVGYGLLRHASSEWPVPSEVLGISLTAFMTFLLICTSVTMVLGLSAIQRGPRGCLGQHARPELSRNARQARGLLLVRPLGSLLLSLVRIPGLRAPSLSAARRLGPPLHPHSQPR